MLRKLYESFPGVHDAIVSTALTRFRIDVDDLPSWEDTDSAVSYRAPLCRDYKCSFHALVARVHTGEQGNDSGSTAGNVEDVVMEEANEVSHDGENLVTSTLSSAYARSPLNDSKPELVRYRLSSRCGPDVVSHQGRIGQDTLSAMIRQDETATRSPRRRFYDVYMSQCDLQGNLRYPAGKPGRFLVPELIGPHH